MFILSYQTVTKYQILLPYFLIQFPPLNSFRTFMYCDLWNSKFKKEQFPRKLYEEIRYFVIDVCKGKYCGTFQTWVMEFLHSHPVMLHLPFYVIYVSFITSSSTKYQSLNFCVYFLLFFILIVRVRPGQAMNTASNSKLCQVKVLLIVLFI